MGDGVVGGGGGGGVGGGDGGVTQLAPASLSFPCLAPTANATARIPPLVASQLVSLPLSLPPLICGAHVRGRCCKGWFCEAKEDKEAGEAEEEVEVVEEEEEEAAG